MTTQTPKRFKCLICKEEVNENEMCKCMRDYINPNKSAKDSCCYVQTDNRLLTKTGQTGSDCQQTKPKRAKDLQQSISKSSVVEADGTREDKPADIIQIATESMKGCGKGFNYIVNETQEVLWVHCGDMSQYGFGLMLCPTCIKVNQAHKQDWESFVSKLDGSYMAMHDEGLRKLKEEYKLALKILKGGK